MEEKTANCILSLMLWSLARTGQGMQASYTQWILLWRHHHLHVSQAIYLSIIKSCECSIKQVYGMSKSHSNWCFTQHLNTVWCVGVRMVMGLNSCSNTTNASPSACLCFFFSSSSMSSRIKWILPMFKVSFYSNS